ncbi:MAG TPA: SPOR domain-containing protein [Terracidiphilus sp.]|nr:SPOR domain-containing protein [Terracidiphilus sp.]
MRSVFDEEDLEPVRPRRDTELTLGSGMLLAIFFGLVLLCGLCFGLGYAMGHRGASTSVASAPGAGASQPFAGNSVAKPSAAAQQQAAQSDAGIPPTATNASQASALPPGAAPGASPQTAFTVSNPIQSAAATQPQVHSALTPSTAIAPSAQTAASGAVRPALGSAGSFMVQIAAVSNQEDADVLTTALRKRGYTVAEQREPIDNLIHVRIGPFATAAEANNWKTRLLNDGYNAIVQQ